MKGKSKRTQMRHEVSDYGKVDRVVQKSLNKESTHFKEKYSGSSILVILAILGKFIKSFFNPRRSPVSNPLRFYTPLKEPLLEPNPNRYKTWYKTHVPKSLRKGLSSKEVTDLRKKFYRLKIRCV